MNTPEKQLRVKRGPTTPLTPSLQSNIIRKKLNFEKLMNGNNEIDKLMSTVGTSNDEHVAVLLRPSSAPSKLVDLEFSNWKLQNELRYKDDLLKFSKMERTFQLQDI